jgi:hypothetical protein
VVAVTATSHSPKLDNHPSNGIRTAFWVASTPSLVAENPRLGGRRGCDLEILGSQPFVKRRAQSRSLSLVRNVFRRQRRLICLWAWAKPFNEPRSMKFQDFGRWQERVFAQSRPITAFPVPDGGEQSSSLLKVIDCEGFLLSSMNETCRAPPGWQIGNHYGSN